MNLARRRFCTAVYTSVYTGAGIAAAALLSTSLGGCGFQLRAAPTFAFRSIYIALNNPSPLAEELKRSLSNTGAVQVLDSAQLKQAEVVLEIVQDQREKVVVGVGAAGQVREFQLRSRVQFRLRTGQGTELIAMSELSQQRDISYSETAALAKETEEALTYRNMQSDLVQQLLRRLAAVRSL